MGKVPIDIAIPCKLWLPFASTSQETVNVKMISRLDDTFTINTTSNANLRSVLKPLYIMMSLLGLFPYSIQLHSVKPGFTNIPKSIYLNFMCAIFYFGIMVVFLVLHIRQLIEASKEALTEAIMTQLNYVIELLTLFIFCTVVYVCFYLDRFKYLKTLNKISYLIESSNINKEKILKQIHRQVSIVVGSLGFLLLLQLAINFSGTDSLYKMTLVMMSFILPHTIQLTSIAFFHTLLMTVIEIFRSVREQMITSTERITTNVLTKAVLRKLTLREIELIYIEVFDVKQIVNQIFEVPILITMMQCFHAIVSESHLIYHGVVIQLDLSIHQIVYCVIWIVFQVLKIYTIANAGNLFKLEAIQLCRSIHNIPTEKHDLQFFLEVQHLSAIMSFPDTELTVFGYFPLDASLVFKVIASAGMYIIILVQFDKAD